jgi:hypothetical protein
MKMKTIRPLFFCLLALLLSAPMLQAQDFSKYRNFSLGMGLPALLKYTGQRMADVKVVHSRPALIQEVTWWPTYAPGITAQSDAVREIVFSLYNGELYKITVTYDRASTEGLTSPDMMRAITAKYGPVASVPLAIDSAADDRYDLTPQIVASWEGSQYSVDLVRFAFTDDFGLLIYSKRVNADADLAIAAAVKLEERERPKREAERQQKETDDLEATRLKNQKIFHP